MRRAGRSCEKACSRRPASTDQAGQLCHFDEHGDGAALGIEPGRCAVVEDTVTGVTAGVAAGATVFGYSPPEAGHDAPSALRRAGAVAVFVDMAELPGLVG